MVLGLWERCHRKGSRQGLGGPERVCLCQATLSSLFEFSSPAPFLNPSSRLRASSCSGETLHPSTWDAENAIIAVTERSIRSCETRSDQSDELITRFARQKLTILIPCRLSRAASRLARVKPRFEQSHCVRVLSSRLVASRLKGSPSQRLKSAPCLACVVFPGTCLDLPRTYFRSDSDQPTQPCAVPSFSSLLNLLSPSEPVGRAEVDPIARQPQR